MAGRLDANSMGTRKETRTVVETESSTQHPRVLRGALLRKTAMMLITAALACAVLAGCAGGGQDASSQQSQPASASTSQDASGAQASASQAAEGQGGAAGQSSAPMAEAVASLDQAAASANAFLLSQGGIGAGDAISGASWYLPGESETDWYVIFSDRAGLGQPDPAYLSELQSYVEGAYQTSDLLGRASGTEWHRIAMAVRAAGGDPTSFGADAQGNPINLVADGAYNYVGAEELSYQGSNALVYAILCVKGGGYDWPAEARYSEDAIVSELLSCQNEAGAFGLSPGGESVDVTAMALQALAFYYGEANDASRAALSEETVTQIDGAVERAVTYLSSAQNADGCYDMEGVYSSDTCSQVVLALCALGIDPAADERFAKEGGNLADALLAFRNADGGFASTMQTPGSPDGSNIMATRQAGCAAVALQLLQQNGNGNFFDFGNGLKDGMQKAA